jgi:hypothetical protein
MKSGRLQIKALLILFLFGFGNEALYSQAKYVPESDSRLWIEGRSNVNTFECDASDYSGDALIYEETGSNNPNEQAAIRIEITVDGFECGRSRMNRDLRNALKADDFPKITFIYGEVTNIEAARDVENAYQLEVNGTLTVAGVTREVTFKMLGYFLNDGRLRAMGSKAIKMTDYNVEPPTAMLGLVKAENELTVHFDLIARRES